MKSMTAVIALVGVMLGVCRSARADDESPYWTQKARDAWVEHVVDSNQPLDRELIDLTIDIARLDPKIGHPLLEAALKQPIDLDSPALNAEQNRALKLIQTARLLASLGRVEEARLLTHESERLLNTGADVFVSNHSYLMELKLALNDVAWIKSRMSADVLGEEISLAPHLLHEAILAKDEPMIEWLLQQSMIAIVDDEGEIDSVAVAQVYMALQSLDRRQTAEAFVNELPSGRHLHRALANLARVEHVAGNVESARDLLRQSISALDGLSPRGKQFGANLIVGQASRISASDIIEQLPVGLLTPYARIELAKHYAKKSQADLADIILQPLIDELSAIDPTTLEPPAELGSFEFGTPGTTLEGYAARCLDVALVYRLLDREDEVKAWRNRAEAAVVLSDEVDVTDELLLLDFTRDGLKVLEALEKDRLSSLHIEIVQLIEQALLADDVEEAIALLSYVDGQTYRNRPVYHLILHLHHQNREQELRAFVEALPVREQIDAALFVKRMKNGTWWVSRPHVIFF